MKSSVQQTKIGQDRSRFWTLVSRIGLIFTAIAAIFGAVTQWQKIEVLIGLVPAPIQSFERQAPGCNETDSRIAWSMVTSEVSCTSNGAIVQKLEPWRGQANAGYAELRFKMQNQAFPSAYTLTVDISDFYDPAVGAGGGCAGLIVHTTDDGATFEALNVCGNGVLAIVKVINNQEIGRKTVVVPGSATPGMSDTYTLTATVGGSSTSMTVTQKNPGNVPLTASLSTDVVGPSTSYVSLAMLWQLAGARATFSQFRYTSGS
jgi:hypothetical protein